MIIVFHIGDISHSFCAESSKLSFTISKIHKTLHNQTINHNFPWKESNFNYLSNRNKSSTQFVHPQFCHQCDHYDTTLCCLIFFKRETFSAKVFLFAIKEMCVVERLLWSKPSFYEIHLYHCVGTNRFEEDIKFFFYLLLSVLLQYFLGGFNVDAYFGLWSCE